MSSNQKYMTWVSWGFTILAYAFLVYKLVTYDQWGTLGQNLSQADATAWLCGLAALVLMPLNMFLEAWRWKYLMGGISMRDAHRQVYFSKMAGQVTPYQLGEYPARGMLIPGRDWTEVLIKGAVGSLTMTLAIILMGIIPIGLWFGAEGWIWYAMVLAGALLLTFLVPVFAKRRIKIHYSQLLASLGQSILRYLCWCVQLAFVLRLFGIAFSEQLLIQIPVYYLVITITPAVSAAEVGVRGAWAMYVFGSVEATLAGVVLWGINTLIPLLIGSFVRKSP